MGIIFVTSFVIWLDQPMLFFELTKTQYKSLEFGVVELRCKNEEITALVRLRWVEGEPVLLGLNNSLILKVEFFNAEGDQCLKDAFQQHVFFSDDFANRRTKDRDIEVYVKMPTNAASLRFRLGNLSTIRLRLSHKIGGLGLPE